MSDTQINLIVAILKDKEYNLTDGSTFYTPDDVKTYLTEIAKEILAKLFQHQKEKAEVQRKALEERDKGINPYEYCSGCYRPNMACKCATNGKYRY